MQALYIHTCEYCIYLGTNNEVDFYVCKIVDKHLPKDDQWSLVARYSDDPLLVSRVSPENARRVHSVMAERAKETARMLF